MECPHCQSTDVQLVSVAYHSGVDTVETTSKHGARLGVGMAAGQIGVGILGGGKTKSRSVSVSNLSQQLAPPSKKSWKPDPMTWGWRAKIGCLPLIWLIVVPTIGEATRTVAGYLLFSLIGIAGAGYTLYSVIGKGRREARDFNQNVWPGLQEVWQRSWFCRRCGATFEVR